MLNALLLIYEFLIRDGRMVLVMNLFLWVYQDTFYCFILWYIQVLIAVENPLFTACFLMDLLV